LRLFYTKLLIIISRIIILIKWHLRSILLPFKLLKQILCLLLGNFIWTKILFSFRLDWCRTFWENFWLLILLRRLWELWFKAHGCNSTLLYRGKMRNRKLGIFLKIFSEFFVFNKLFNIFINYPLIKKYLFYDLQV
jgi:hypothetical protein